MTDYAYNLDDSDFGREQRIGASTIPWTDTVESTIGNAWVQGSRGAYDMFHEGFAAADPQSRALEVQGLQAMATGQADAASLAPLPAPIADADGDRFVDPATLNKQYKDIGLNFAAPQRKGAVDILVDAKREQIQRDFILSHGPQGFSAGVANFGLSLAASATDPLNVAAAFVPVVGEARAALWAERFGPTLARVIQGGVEGGVGTAALQPFDALRAHTFQEEYGPLDAFMNVAFGSVFGGGLHAGFGKISDFVNGLHPDTRETALASAVGQMAEGRPVDVSATLSADPAMQGAGADFPTDLARARAQSEAFQRGDEPSTASSPSASDIADREVKEKLGDDLDAEHQRVMVEVADYEKQGILTPEEAAQARSGSDDMARAQSEGNAAKAAARCLLLHP